MVSATDRKPRPMRTVQIPLLDEAAKKRFESKYEVDESGCWLWQGCLNGKGYGRFYYSGTQYMSHRVAYTIQKGPITDGLFIDHLCRTRNCANAEHMELVTNRENTVRGINFIAGQVRQTQCIRGHEFTPENTYVDPGRQSRSCRTCRTARRRARRKRNV